MARIEKQDNKLIVPDVLTIPYIEGDGVGIEITSACKKIVEHTINTIYKGKRKIEWLEVLGGEKAYNKTGQWLPSETINTFKEFLIGIKGPLTTPVGGGIRSLNVALRQDLDLFVCLRPVEWFTGISSPLKYPNKVNMVVFRENTEDIYAGIEWNAGTEEATKFYNFLYNEMGVKKVRFPNTSSFGVKPVSREGTTRLVRSAIKYAIDNKKPSVTLVHKGNIMKFTEGSFKKWGYEVAEKEFASYVFTMNQYNNIKKEQGTEIADKSYQEAVNSNKIVIKDNIADAFLQNTLLKPEDYSVIATLNLNGDYISDQLAAMVGGIGIAPGANINYDTGHAIFEATHGTAPDIAGKNVVNPCSMLLSFAMLFEYVSWIEVSEKIKNALVESFKNGYATHDLARFMENGKSMSTTDFADNLITLIK